MAGTPSDYSAPSVNDITGGRHRPLPRLPGLVAAAGGGLLVVGFVILIGNFSQGSRRPLSIVVSLALEAVGVAGLWLWRRRPAYTGAVAVTLLAILPAWFFLVVNTKAKQPIHSIGDFKTKVTIILILAMAGWVALFLLAPVRRQPIYLGGALVALVVLAVLQISISTQSIGGYRSQSVPPPASSITPTPRPHPARLSQDSGYSSDSSSYSDSGSYSNDFSGSYSDQFSDSGGSGNTGIIPGNGLSFGPIFGFPKFAPGKFATVLVLFGLAYLAAGYLLDRRREARMATVLFAVGVVTVILGISASGGTDFGLWGASILGLIVGGATTWASVKGARRASSWIAIVGTAVAVGAMAERLLERHPLAMGFLFLAIGVAVMFLADQLTGRIDPFPHDDGRLPGRPDAGPPQPRTRPAGPVTQAFASAAPQPPPPIGPAWPTSDAPSPPPPPPASGQPPTQPASQDPPVPPPG